MCYVTVCLASVAGMQPLAAVHADDGLVAHYTFEEGPSKQVNDWSGNGNYGKIEGDVAYVALGEGKGYALRFNSGEAYVDCGNTPSLDLTDAVTLAVWFYPETSIVGKGFGGVFGKEIGSYCLSYTGKCWFHVPSGADHDGTLSVSPFSWHHIVATFDGKRAKLYVDGKLQSVRPSTVDKLPHGGNFYLRYPATWLTVEPEYKCMLDDGRVYNRALSEQQVKELYKTEVKAGGKHDATWFDKVKLTLHTFPQGSTLVVEASYTDMGVWSPSAVLKLEVRAAGGKVIAQHRMPVKIKPADKAGAQGAIRLDLQDVEKFGAHYWPLNVKDLPAGHYEVRAVVAAKDGKKIGNVSSLSLKLPLEKRDWIKAYDGAKILNNLVAELLNVESVQIEARKAYTFTNPRNGWVFISSTAKTQGTDRTLVSVNTIDTNNAAIVHSKETDNTLEAMQYLPQGRHKVYVHCEESARLSRLTVRAIPEMMVAGLGYTMGSGWPLVAGQHVPILPCFGHYNMAYLDRIGLLDSINVLIERNPVSENAAHVKKWREQGKKLIVRHGMWPTFQLKEPTVDSIFKLWTEYRGFAGEGYDGLILDEFSGFGHGGVGRYPLYTQVVKKIAQDPAFKGKVFYPYCMPMYHCDLAMGMLKNVVDTGSRWAEEKYLVEQPTEESARFYMDTQLRQNVLHYERTFPGAARHMITTLGFFSAPPLTLNSEPGVDYKVYLDMQMHLLANDPVLFGLYGIHWYHNGYVDEEYLRWSAKLLRHYGIEGRKERLTEDPYILPHIKNPDFDEGNSEWTLQPAEAGAIFTEHAAGYGILQTRVAGGDKKPGDNFLVTRRGAKAPNRFSQQIRQLTPGRTYSVKMFTADYGDLKKGKSDNETDYINIKIDGVDLILEKEFHQRFPTSLAGSVFGPFNVENSFYLTYHRVVFRAKATEAVLTISDWASNTDPGGPIGQELMYNFIEVQSYLDDSDLPALKQVKPNAPPPPAVVVPDEQAIKNAPDSTPVARYGFDEGKGDVAASAANGPQASIHGAKHVKARKGYALEFDGNDDYVTVAESEVLSIGGPNMTVECWFKIDDLKAKWRGLCGNYHSGMAGYMLAYTNGNVVFYSGAETNGPSCKVRKENGPWHHAVGVIDNGTMAVYVDGVREASPLFANQKIVPGSYPFEIGRYNFGQAFSGQIDDVAVYDTALTHAEIAKRYRRGRR